MELCGTGVNSRVRASLDGDRTSLTPHWRQTSSSWPFCPSAPSDFPRPLSSFTTAGWPTWKAQLAASGADWNRITRDLLFQIYYPGVSDYDELLQDPKTPDASKVTLLSLDPWNITLEPEYYADVDQARFARVKPLLWLWYSFDRSPLGGQNVHLGVRFRRILAPHIFARVGKNFKAFQYVEFSFGYNLEVGDDVVVHRNVLLDDRGGIILGNRVSISDYANIYSHTHSIVDQKDVTNARTVLEDDVRITYHATVLAGVRVGQQRHGRSQRGGDEGRPSLPRQRRHSRQVDPGEAERSARGVRDRAGRPARPGALSLARRSVRPPLSLAAVAAGVLLGCVLAAAVIGDPPVLGTLVVVAAGAADPAARHPTPRVGARAPRHRGGPAGDRGRLVRGPDLVAGRRQHRRRDHHLRARRGARARAHP